LRAEVESDDAGDEVGSDDGSVGNRRVRRLQKAGGGVAAAAASDAESDGGDGAGAAVRPKVIARARGRKRTRLGAVLDDDEDAALVSSEDDEQRHDSDADDEDGAAPQKSYIDILRDDMEKVKKEKQVRWRGCLACMVC
jgi:hypothetical protein